MTAAARLESFLAETSKLVGELVAAMKPDDQVALDRRLELGATLRLVVVLAPSLSIVLYVAIADVDPPRTVVLATFDPNGRSDADPAEGIRDLLN